MSREPSAAVDRTTTRRSAITSIGALVGGATVGVAAQQSGDAQQSDNTYRLRQGEDAVAIEPLTGETPVADLYDYRLPSAYVSPDGDASADAGPYYQSVGTESFQRADTTVSFLYDGPEGLSLVVVHDSPSDDDGGAVTWQVRTRPEAVEWLVRDDRYRRPGANEPAATNYDAWASEGRRHRVDWTWGSSATDGGVLGHFPHEFALAVDPHYGERARLHGEHYDGALTDWEFLSGDPENPTRHALATDEPVAITGNWTGPDPLSRSFPDLETDLAAVDTDGSRTDGTTDAAQGNESTTEHADETATDEVSTETRESGTDASTPSDAAEDESGAGGDDGDERDDEPARGDGDEWHGEEWDDREEWEREEEWERDDEWEDERSDDDEDEWEDEEVRRDDEREDDDDEESEDGDDDDEDERESDDEEREGRGPPPWANDDGERDEDDEQRGDGRGRGPPPWANGNEQRDDDDREDGDED